MSFAIKFKLPIFICLEQAFQTNVRDAQLYSKAEKLLADRSF